VLDGPIWSESFNPSVGILFIQAKGAHSGILALELFQSLGRDSVHSSWFWTGKMSGNTYVSIPRSGFCSFKPKQKFPQPRQQAGFNPSVGILFIQARLLLDRLLPHARFQSLGRDSVHSSSTGNNTVEAHNGSFNPSVGILFIQAKTGTGSVAQGDVSIPRSGFCSFKLGICSEVELMYVVFQSLGRDSVHSSSNGIE